MPSIDSLPGRVATRMRAGSLGDPVASGSGSQAPPARGGVTVAAASSTSPARSRPSWRSSRLGPGCCRSVNTSMAAAQAAGTRTVLPSTLSHSPSSSMSAGAQPQAGLGLSRSLGRRATGPAESRRRTPSWTASKNGASMPPITTSTSPRCRRRRRRARAGRRSRRSGSRPRTRPGLGDQHRGHRLGALGDRHPPVVDPGSGWPRAPGPQRANGPVDRSGPRGRWWRPRRSPRRGRRAPGGWASRGGVGAAVAAPDVGDPHKTSPRTGRPEVGSAGRGTRTPLLQTPPRACRTPGAARLWPQGCPRSWALANRLSTRASARARCRARR